VNAVAPGPVETQVLVNAGLPAEAITGLKAGITKSLPMGRMARPNEIARWIVASADPAVTWVTGQVLSIDGGMSLI
jgi:NAD(P)-dependent dehydrogenase (short-subunit alcohol dehydrogenase family)